MAYSHICFHGFRGASWDGPLFFWGPQHPPPRRRTDPGRQTEKKMRQPVADSTFFRNFALHIFLYWYDNVSMYNFIFITRGPSWDAPLFFLCPFCPSRPLLPPRRTDTGRQAERGKITPWNVASGIFFVTLCDLRYVLLIFCIINLLNYFFSIFLMFRGPSWDAPLLFLGRHSLPSRTPAEQDRRPKAQRGKNSRNYCKWHNFIVTLYWFKFIAKFMMIHHH